MHSRAGAVSVVRVTAHGSGSTRTPWQQKVDSIRAHNLAERQRVADQIRTRNQLMASGVCGFLNQGVSTRQGCSAITPADIQQLPKAPKGKSANNSSAGAGAQAQQPVPQLTPEEAAYIAVSVALDIPSADVQLGPDPDGSKWHMAVVGHPYWMWVTGPTHLGPVSDSTAGMQVTLDATLSSVEFDMGDGHTVTCQGTGTPYRGGDDLYNESPTCGHRYQRTSSHQPGGTYTITAVQRWNVAYSTPIGSGTIPIVLASQRQLVVGELQSLVTG